MSEMTFLTPQEQEISRQYDDQRRLRLARIVAPVSWGLSSLVALILTIYLLFHLHSPDSFIVVLTIVCWMIAMCDTLGVILARNGHANPAAIAICGAVILAIVVLLVDTLSTTGLNVFSLILLLALPLAIVMSGIMGNTALLLTVTMISILGGCAVLLFNTEAPVLGGNGFVVTILFFAILSSVGVMMLIFQQGYQRTLRDLGDTRIAYERASALDDLKNQFIVNVNHELRNPVMAMMGHLDVLDMSLATAPRERLQKAAKGAMRAAENLRTLLASILDANRLEQGAGDFTPEAVPLVQALEAAIQLIDPNEGNLHERELRVKVPNGLSVWGEPVRLQQILTNLLSNALKYSPPGTPIEVRARVIIETAPAPSRRRRSTPGTGRRLVEITVRDWGLGIPPEQVPLLFQRFVRLPRDLASNIIGNGLGLYLCRICAEAMGGRIWVESSGVEGEGSLFHLRLPAPPAPAA
jgi:signal transduction histidine kinase